MRERVSADIPFILGASQVASFLVHVGASKAGGGHTGVREVFFLWVIEYG